MADKEIRIGGIERNLSPANKSDGAMEMLVGWKFSDGNLRPAQGTVYSGLRLKNSERLVYVHKYGDYCHYVIYDENDNVLLAYNSTGREDEILKVTADNVSCVISVGNILSASTGYGLMIFVYKNGRYVKFNRAELPVLDFVQMKEETIYSSMTDILALKNGDVINLPQNKPQDGVYKFSDDDFLLNNGSTFTWQKNEVKENAYQNDRFIEDMYVRYGLRLYDGTYIYVSPPILIKQMRDYQYRGYGDYHFISTNAAGTSGYWGIDYFRNSQTYCDSYSLSLSFRDKEKYSADSDLFPAVDIFFSLPINRYERVERIGRTKRFDSPEGKAWGEKGWYPVEWDIESQKKGIKVEQNINYYKVAEIKTADLDPGFSLDLHVGDKMMYIEQLPVLEYNTRPHEYYSRQMSVYNNRLHIYEIRERLFGGWTIPYFTYERIETGSSQGMLVRRAVSIVYLMESAEEYVSVKTRGETACNITLSELLSYPDGRATRLVIAWEDGNNNCYKIDVQLKTHPFQDMAYYYEDGATIESIREIISNTDFEALYSTEDKNTIYRPNVMKVSELNNPAVFPVNTTYMVGSGTINATAVATKTISQGQFGQYPLYVFTTGGIYAMQSGSGDVVYTNMAPVSRHVCENVQTICPIDDAVVFGTEQGLFVMQGGDAVNISTPLDEHGIVRDSEESGTLAWVVKELTGKSLYNGSLRSIISNGRTAYHYKAGEILLYVPNTEMVYAYSVKHKQWCAYAIELDYTVDNYPDLLLVERSNATVDTSEVAENGDEIQSELPPAKIQSVMKFPDEDSDIISRETLLVTRPLMLSTCIQMKRIVRAHILSYIRGIGTGKSRVVLGIAGSNDGEEWEVVWKSEVEVSKLYSPAIPVIGASYRFYSVIIHMKDMDKRTYVNSFVMEYENTFSDR